jgi:transcriptional regulator with XRE-family HTH domain
MRKRNIHCVVATMAKNIALKIAIVKSGLSQMEVAKAADMHDSRLSRIVNGHDEPSEAERDALTRVLKRRPADLFPKAAA